MAEIKKKGKQLCSSEIELKHNNNQGPKVWSTRLFTTLQRHQAVKFLVKENQMWQGTRETLIY